MASASTETEGNQGGGLLLPEQGAGPLLQRDYWAVIKGCQHPPSTVMNWVARRFPEFAPAELCVFNRTGESCEGEPLEPGDELTVKIQGAGTFGVRVIHKDAQSLTLATLPGHPEAGRITFGAYRNDHGDVIFHIRSRARSGSLFHYVGFVGAGEAMQTNTWTEFVLRVAVTAGEGVVGVIHADTTELEDEPEGSDPEHDPTFLAKGDAAHD
ncbi:DUF1990 family protein [Myxococcus sp. RHSTA-1-4]|uniref:DUF1990 family protein n=1 Tax=Myxococcus sp. RHSTA-1-4 TaxID=2874601 RepID=UPI001CBA801D|nr:DUF1990 family protein [Myxococcus sp. RHSTA-1-4]MBZ4419811.1 DUF1990 domain-containing protein [Myxococcus sp. RHSTA-1-4]